FIFQVPLESLDQLSESSLSWVLRENERIWHVDFMIAEFKEPVDEGDVVGLSYDQVES
ncbi:hypothetical protein PHET_10035, partial [Paragonimus heterotremus]